MGQSFIPLVVATNGVQGLIQDFLLGGGNHIFEEILDIFGQQNRQIQLYNFSNSIFIGYRPV